MRIVRHSTGLEGTPGTWTLADGTELKSIELPWLENRNRISCIPPGKYKLRIRKAEESGKLSYDHVHVQDVPGRTWILMHGMNWAGSEADGFECDALGCIGPGMSRANNGRQPGVNSSRKALKIVMEAIRNGDDELEIAWETDPAVVDSR